MKQLLLFICLFAVPVVFGQTEDVTYEYRKGKKYIVHYAEDGNTLWGIHSTYHVPVDDIVAANPGIEKGVIKGQKIMIPVGNAEAGTKDGMLIREHTIVKGETLYSIAKREAVTVDELNKLNPDAAAGLKLGQVIRIPVKDKIAVAPNPVPVQPAGTKIETKVTFHDTVIDHTVRSDETLYSISKRFMVPVIELQEFNKLKSNKIKPGEVIKIPLKKEQVKQVEIRKVDPVVSRKVDEDLIFKSKNEYHIAVLLPFDLDGANSNLKGIATEFYMGVELAADSLEKLGLKAVFHVYDSENDSVEVVKLLKKPEMKNMDLVIGPLMPQVTDVVAAWCKQNQVRMVCPASVNSSVLINNPYVYAAVSSDITQQEVMAKYIVENYSRDQIVLVNTGIARDRDLYDAFRQRFMELSRSRGNIKLIEIKTEDLAGYIRKNSGTTFIVPTRDKGATLKFMNLLQKTGNKAGTGTITVFGTREWGNFDDLSGMVKNKFNVHWAASSDLNYTLPETKALLRNYRKKYNADMGKFGAQGFDVTYYFVRSLLMDKPTANCVINSFDMKQLSAGNGFENNQCFILRNTNFELERIATMHD